MSSHVPFLAVRPDDQFSTEVKRPASSSSLSKANAVPPSLPMDSPPPLMPAPPRTYAGASVPSVIRFPLLVGLSLILSTALHSLTAEFSGIALATASRRLDEPWQIGLVMGWKVVQLFVAWTARYDYEDIAALTLLTNQPLYYLLHSYYAVPFIPLAMNLAFDVVVVALPFALLRPLTRAHDPLSPKTSNQVLAMDWQIMLLTAGLGSTIYAVAFYLSYHANLGVFLITHFDNMATMSAHDSTIPQLLQLFGAMGLAAMFFLFRPTIAAAGVSALREKTPRVGRKAKRFNAETATLGETFAYNLGYGENGWSHRAEVLAKRTAVVALSTFVNTVVRVFSTVEGTDIGGSLGYAGLWAGANVLVGVAYGLLSNEE